MALPVSIQQAGSVGTFAPGRDARSGAGVGDVLLVPKPQLFRASGLSTAVAVPVSLPMGSSDSYLGHGGATVGPRLIAKYEFAKGLRLSGNAGVVLRRASKQLDLEVGNAVMYAVGRRCRSGSRASDWPPSPAWAARRS